MLSNYILGLSYLVIVAMLPILTSIADYRGHKKLYMQLFTWMGSLACAGLFFFTMDTFNFRMICFGLASIGYCGGFVFYNSYLPQIATIDRQDAVSAKGFIYGFGEASWCKSSVLFSYYHLIHLVLLMTLFRHVYRF